MRQRNWTGFTLGLWIGILCIGWTAFGEDGVNTPHENDGSAGTPASAPPPQPTVVLNPNTGLPSFSQQMRVITLRNALEIALGQKPPQVRNQVLDSILRANASDAQGRTVGLARAVIETLPKNIFSEDERKLLFDAANSPFNGAPATREELISAARALQSAAEGAAKGATVPPTVAKADGEKKDSDPKKASSPEEAARKALEDRLVDLTKERDRLQRAKDDGGKRLGENPSDRGQGGGPGSGGAPDAGGGQPQNNSNDPISKGLEHALNNLSKNKDKDKDDLANLFKGIDDGEKSDAKSNQDDKKKKEPLFDFGDFKNKLGKNKDKDAENELPKAEAPATPDEGGADGAAVDPSTSGGGAAAAGSFKVPEAISGSSRDKFDSPSFGTSGDSGAASGSLGGLPITGGGGGAASGSGGSFGGAGEPFSAIGQPEPTYGSVKYNYLKSGAEGFTSGQGDTQSASSADDSSSTEESTADSKVTKGKFASVASQVRGPWSGGRFGGGVGGKRGIFALIHPCTGDEPLPVSLCDRIRVNKAAKQSGLLMNLGVLSR